MKSVFHLWTWTIGALAVWLAAACPLSAQLPPEEPFGEEPDPVPLVGRPGGFSGASGSFRVEASVDRDEAAEGQPLFLTVRVYAMGPVRRAPDALPLGELATLGERFLVEPVRGLGEERAARAASLAGLGGAGGQAPLHAALALGVETTWSAVYRLVPLGRGPREIPSLPFVFHDPRIPIPERSFQTAYTRPISVRIRAPEVIRVPLRVPAWITDLPEAQTLLARPAAGFQPGPAVLALVVMLPPLGCLAWYLLWRRLYPDAARQARRRRSRAARQALRALARARKVSGERQAELAARITTAYLQQRVDLRVAEPTPHEAAGHLLRVGCPQALATQAFQLYQGCDEARFLPVPAERPGSYCDEAVRLILALEAET